MNAGDFECIIVDNGSTDTSFLALKKRYPDVKIIRSPVNLGFAGAVNKGLEIARGRYLCLFNSDAILTKNAIGSLIQFLEKTKECGIVCPQLLNKDGSLQTSFDNFPTIWSFLFNKSLLRIFFPKIYPSKYQKVTKPREIESVIGACIVVKREVLEETGNFDEDYFFFLEETDLCLKAKKAGWKIFFLPDVKVFHLQGKTKEKFLVGAKVEYLNSLYIFFAKNYSLPICIFAGIVGILKIFINMLFFIILSIVTLFLNKFIRRRFLSYMVQFLYHLGFSISMLGLRDINCYKEIKIDKMIWKVDSYYELELTDAILKRFNQLQEDANKGKEIFEYIDKDNKRYVIKKYNRKTSALKVFSAQLRHRRAISEISLPIAVGVGNSQSFVIYKFVENRL
jgi:hypothetical protein